MTRIGPAIRACLVRDDDLRSPAAHGALQRVLERRSKGIVLSVGGGPSRADARMTNLNIVLADGVDIVATAYQLPFDNDSVAAVHCEAVLEHLEFPQDGVYEMFRVLRPGGLLYAATPFLQPYHGYPDHFQNLTLHGHVRLFERAGFTILDSGTCVGPTFALVDIAANYARGYLPTKILSRAVERAIRLLGRPLRLFDLANTARSESSLGCSTTFVFADKA